MQTVSVRLSVCLSLPHQVSFWAGATILSCFWLLLLLLVMAKNNNSDGKSWNERQWTDAGSECGTLSRSLN